MMCSLMLLLSLCLTQPVGQLEAYRQSRSRPPSSPQSGLSHTAWLSLYRGPWPSFFLLQNDQKQSRLVR